MKKRYLAIAGLLVLAVAAAGCGKEKDKPAEQQVQATPTVTPQVTEAADLVDMEVSDEKKCDRRKKPPQLLKLQSLTGQARK